MAKKKDMTGHNHSGHKVTTLDLIKEYLRLKINKMNPIKKPLNNNNISMIDSIPKEQVNHIAIVLDGKVQEILRAQNRLAALLLSEPEFVNFDPAEMKVELDYLYVDGKFVKEEIEE
jgi:hypothetical protein